MKIRHFFIYLSSLCFCCDLLAQEKKIVFCDAVTKMSIEGVYVFNSSSSFISNANGEISFPEMSYKYLSASHILYNIRKFHLNDIKDSLFLVPREYTLDEVTLVEHEFEKTIIFPKDGLRKLIPQNWGKCPPIPRQLMIAMYFPNEYSEKLKKLNKVLVSTSDYDIHFLNEKSKAHRKDAAYSPFYVNIYTADSFSLLPKNKVFEEDMIIKKEKGAKFAEFELPINFYIPDNGFFVVIHNLKQEELEALGYHFRPGITTIGAPKNNKYLPFEFNTAVDDHWKLYKYLVNRGNTYLIGVEVQEYE
jgi:hypothetical protein